MEGESIRKPALVAHADWSKDPKKRWHAVARLEADDHYRVSAPTMVGCLSSYFRRLRGNLGRPFYPAGSTGGTKKQHLVKALNLTRDDDPRRRCERSANAQALFWLVGAKQVGRAERSTVPVGCRMATGQT